MKYPHLEAKLEPYILQLFRRYPNEQLIFHSIDHTRQVAARAEEIAVMEQIGEHEELILKVAAWFHDTGHLNGGIEDHELRSIDLMREFMAENEVDDPEFIQTVADCIMATRMPHNPKDKLQQIMCDADVYHFGTKEFKQTNKQVRKELELRNYPQLTTNWLQRSLALLEVQHYFTPYCQKTLHEGKLKNVQRLKKKLKEKGEEIEPLPPDAINDPAMTEASGDTPATDPATGDAVVPEPSGKEKAKQQQSLIARGIQTFLRLASENHISLSAMADGKANILISVNAIIISVILSVFINRLEVDTHLVIPTIIFLASSVATIVIAILATRPKLTEGNFLKEDVMNRKTNLMFFGNFYKSSLEDYEWAMDRLLKDKEYIYGTLVKDIYFLGKVLGRKYKLIRLAYNVFMIGILLSVTAFTVATLFNMPRGHVTVLDGTGSPL